ncbi:hypothetical protein [Spiroplasma endosymbiont of Aspidapion aeneum]|uniref:hypothetical protein n=1 Tax=Spiroplasma endosymbiont of Aspidapion aeneum TaxID=3066276 RepID=UPI00313B90A0
MKKIISLLGITSIFSITPLQVMSFKEKNTPLTQTTDEYTIKSNYVYKSGSSSRDFDDSSLIDSIYGEINKLIEENKQNITTGSIQIKSGSSSYTNFDNFEKIMDPAEIYAQNRVIDASKYEYLKLSGHEEYSWSWSHACPSYEWGWKYKDNYNRETGLYSFSDRGYGSAEINIDFRYFLTYAS